MTSDSVQPGALGVAADALTRREEPTLDWSEADLLSYLAEAWDQHNARHIKVIGSLSQTDGNPFAFLEDLHHPGTGVKLGAPIGNSRVHQGIYVSPAELQRFQKHCGDATYAAAELDISPRPTRVDRSDPLACTVRPGTLDALSKMPKAWGLSKIDSESVPLIAETARRAIDERLSLDTADAEKKLRGLKSTVKQASSDERALNEKLKQTIRDLDEQKARIDTLDADFMHRRQDLENQFRTLEAFLRERGERMVALDLVDKEDLDKLFPPAGMPDVREGHGFADALGADLQRLTAYVQAYLWRKGMRYTRAQLLDFITLLRTNDLIVLAGDSGSGKTSLVKSVASAIGARCTIVPVKPNWTSSEDLLGYYNPIEQRYRPSQFLLALLDAVRDPEVPHFICLDEMNLARVEYYFADFLSLLETRGAAPWIHLYSAAEERQAVADNRIFLALADEAQKRAQLPRNACFEDILTNDQANLELRKLAGFQESDTVLAHHAKIRRSIAGLIDVPAAFQFPRNVWIIGAINVDETTHYLSPKILDRAHVMRFRNPVLMDWDDVEKELKEFDLDMDLPVNVLASDIGTRTEYPIFDQADPHVKLLVDLAREYLDPLGIEFGLRAIRQSLNYIQKGADAGMGIGSCLNNIALHKILPKIMLDMEKEGPNGQKRRDVLVDLRDALAKALTDFDEGELADSAVDYLDALIKRADSNNGIANFWAR